jgi:hypothetical protein
VIWSRIVAPLLIVLGAAGCTFNCDNAGVSVDAGGNIVVKGAVGFISPNSTVLRNVRDWPAPPSGGQNFAFSQGYVLTRDGGMYVLENTAYHPNLVYRINLGSGEATTIGSPEKSEDSPSAMTRSKETSIAADDHYVYSVDQTDPQISRMGISGGSGPLEKLIYGEKTLLRAPLAVDVASNGRLCALDSETLLLLCYAPAAKGNVAPTNVLNLKTLLGYAQVDDITFDRGGRVVVSGTGDPNGLAGFILAVIDISSAKARVIRTISGPSTKLYTPYSLAVDNMGNILVLQQLSGELLAFAPHQSGNVAPFAVRAPAAGVTHPFRMALDRKTGNVAILGSDGIALFAKAGNRSPKDWPTEVRRPMRGWSVAFANSELFVADEFGSPVRMGRHEKANKASPTKSQPRTLNLHDPQFIATDQDGRIYVAATDGVITPLPRRGSDAVGTATSFVTTFGRDMDAFAADSGGYFYLSSASNDAIVTVSKKGHQSIISGSRTTLDHPIGLAVGSDGSLYVANTSGKSILVFPRGSSGNVAPAREIAGDATELVAPQAVAIDAGGKLYVFDGPVTASGSGGQHYVRVYGSGANGNIAPNQSYSVNTKCWANTL